jgi:hypothetical protein
MAKSRKNTSEATGQDVTPSLGQPAQRAVPAWLAYLGPHPLIARIDHIFARGQPRAVRAELADVLKGTGEFEEREPSNTQTNTPEITDTSD